MQPTRHQYQQQQQQQQQQNLVRVQNTTLEGLRRSILESAYIGQEQAISAQEELDRQGAKIKGSLGDAKVIADQTYSTGKRVNTLINEVKASKIRKILQCCYLTCCYCCTRHLLKSNIENNDAATTNYQMKPTTASPSDQWDESENENDTLVRLDRLKVAMAGEKGEAVAWKKTLGPPPGVVYSGTDIWHRQIDASLTQLQQIAEDMGQSLEEQTRMAQMLTIYLDYGVDQVLGARDTLVAEKNSINVDFRQLFKDSLKQ